MGEICKNIATWKKRLRLVVYEYGDHIDHKFK